jgi:hypothetical protein
MLKKTLLALSVAWTGTAAAASNSLDDVTMNIVNETAFKEIINANPAEIERIMNVNVNTVGNAQPVRTIVLQNMDANLLNATPVNGQVITVNKEINQGMVSFSFICAEGQDCQQRVESLNTTSGFVLSTPAGAGINITPGVGIEIAPLPAGLAEDFIIVEGAESGPINLLPAEGFDFDAVNVLPLERVEFNPANATVIDAAAGGAGIFTPVGGQ